MDEFLREDLFAQAEEDEEMDAPSEDDMDDEDEDVDLPSDDEEEGL